MSWKQERARIAGLTRSRAADDPELIEARRRLRGERLAEHVAKVVAGMPPLTDAQCERIAGLLLAGGE